MQSKTKLYSLSLMLILFFGANLFDSFAQEQSGVGISLYRWQTDTPIQVVGAGFGEKALVDDVFLFNSSPTTINRIQIGGLAFVAGNHFSTDPNDFVVLESEPIQVSIAPLNVVRLKKTSLWDFSQISSLGKKSGANKFILRVGIISANSEDGSFYEINLKRQELEKKQATEAEQKRIDELWSKHGYKQLLKLAEQLDGGSVSRTSKETSTTEDTQPSTCYRNIDRYHTTWCKRISQTSCMTFECEGSGFCPRDHCWRVM